MSTTDITLCMEDGTDVTFSFSPSMTASLEMGGAAEFEAAIGTVVGLTRDYEALDNLPSIDGVELVGDMAAGDLGLAGYSDLQAHIEDGTMHVTAAERAAWNQAWTGIVIYPIRTLNNIFRYFFSELCVR